MCNDCGLLVGADMMVGVYDDNGCVLRIGHAGPHEFVARDGTAWQWETDWACDCEQCRQDDGDSCVLYWQKAKDEDTATSTQPA